MERRRFLLPLVLSLSPRPPHLQLMSKSLLERSWRPLAWSLAALLLLLSLLVVLVRCQVST